MAEIYKEEEEKLLKIHEELEHRGTETSRIYLNNSNHAQVSRNAVRKIAENCETCLKYTGGDKNLAVKRLQLAEPFGRIHVDTIGPLQKTESVNKYITVAIDSMTRWLVAQAFRTKSARVVAKFFSRDIITRHGAPQQLVSDQGKEFLNETIDQLYRMANTDKSDHVPIILNAMVQLRDLIKP